MLRNALRRARRMADLTQAQLAQRIGISRYTYIKIEKGQQEPSLTLARAIANALGTTIDSVFLPSSVQEMDNGVRHASA